MIENPFRVADAELERHRKWCIIQDTAMISKIGVAGIPPLKGTHMVVCVTGG